VIAALAYLEKKEKRPSPTLARIREILGGE